MKKISTTNILTKIFKKTPEKKVKKKAVSKPDIKNKTVKKNISVKKNKSIKTIKTAVVKKKKI